MTTSSQSSSSICPISGKPILRLTPEWWAKRRASEKRPTKTKESERQDLFDKRLDKFIEYISSGPKTTKECRALLKMDATAFSNFIRIVKTRIALKISRGFREFKYEV